MCFESAIIKIECNKIKRFENDLLSAALDVSLSNPVALKIFFSPLQKSVSHVHVRTIFDPRLNCLHSVISYSDLHPFETERRSMIFLNHDMLLFCFFILLDYFARLARLSLFCSTILTISIP